MQLGKKWGWRKREYASGTISGLLASTQNETSFICDDKDSQREFPLNMEFICDDKRTNRQTDKQTIREDSQNIVNYIQFVPNGKYNIYIISFIFFWEGG